MDNSGWMDFVSGSNTYWMILGAVAVLAVVGVVWSFAAQRKRMTALMPRRDPSAEETQSDRERLYAPLEPVKHHYDGQSASDDVYGELLESIRSKKAILLLKGILVWGIGVAFFLLFPVFVAEMEFSSGTPELIKRLLPWIPLVILFCYGIAFFLQMAHHVDLYERGMVFHTFRKEQRCFYSDVTDISIYKTHDVPRGSYTRMTPWERAFRKYWICEIAAKGLPLQRLKGTTYAYLYEKAVSLDRNLITPDKSVPADAHRSAGESVKI